MNHETPPDEEGMILINVLIIVMLATAVLAIMLASQDSDVERNLKLRAAAQGMAIARGGEMSAIAALRRDVASGSTTDTLAEPWANIGDRDASIVGGRFSFVVADAQARFNINNLAQPDVISQDQLRQAADLAGIAPERIGAILTLLQGHGPISDLSILRDAGLSDGELQRLAQFCTALPAPTTINVNTASEALLAVAIGNPAAAHAIIASRVRGDGAGMQSGLVLSPGLGVKSDYFWARGRVTVNGTTQQLTSLLRRRQEQGQPIVEVIRRWRGAAPLEAPPLPDQVRSR